MFKILKQYIRSILNRSSIGNKIYLSIRFDYYKLRLLVPDKKFAETRYYKLTRERLNLDNPKTFNEKLWWLKLNNREPLLTKCSDKVKVRDYVKECGLEHILNEVYGVYDNAIEIVFDKLPDKAFIKTNHGSGTNRLWDKKINNSIKISL